MTLCGGRTRTRTLDPPIKSHRLVRQIVPTFVRLEGSHDLPILRQEVSGRLDFVAFAVERAVVLIAPLAAS